ncbi:response regulator [bacterium]|nr:response regulator [bacterium]
MTARRILIADDEAGIRELYRIVLSPLGYEIVAVHDGLAALEALRRQPFDLVVLDMQMPRMDGRETLKNVLEMRTDQKIIIVSGGLCPEQRAQAPAGISDIIYLTKPFVLGDLRKLVADALATSPEKRATA